MRKRGLIASAVVTAGLLCSAMAHAMTIAPAPAVAAGDAAISSWTALAAYSTDVVDPDRLCYWDYQDKDWIPADSQQSIELRKTDPRPVFREPNLRLGRCGGEPPAAALAGLGAVFGAFVYIATKDERGKFEPASPS